MPRREQGALLREVRLKQAEKPVKAPVPAPQSVQEGDDEMDQDEEEPESEEEGEGTRNAPIEVVAETALPSELPKTAEERRRPRVEEATTETMPKKTATAMGQWAGGPPKDKRRVVLDEGSLRVSRQERREAEETTPRAMSTDTESEVGHQSADTEERGVPVFEDMEEPTVEIAVWTTARDEALKNVTAE